ncbi:uncharacterized protein BDZ99DRAFT_234896 [Mytilinidion resinicola]|uniref:Uncharacterized protein n=1 Tax=Mytilinidion resinicola TaxID=574789 RepID=A0A6A6Z1X5_9PEZI|nr:uncharacterized protein BDZ99DRAFT_234896 [Mytilinidion resinicola]KAF2814294.1 hypothetical protein BDZ99DRAFT_234896 [Mytilinidion resinicola]
MTPSEVPLMVLQKATTMSRSGWPIIRDYEIATLFRSISDFVKSRYFSNTIAAFEGPLGAQRSLSRM